MATRIRTLNFLPEIFKTTTNAQVLSATLDQLVAQPNTKKIEGYVGSKFGYGVNAKNYYVTEPTKTRTDYQLDPGVVFLKDNQETAKDFISYPGIIDALKLQGSLTENNSRLFESQFYSWDSFTDLDKVINFNQYYWLPEGPERVTISSGVVFSNSNYNVTDIINGYIITADNEASGSVNPSLTLLRGGSYTFNVNQTSQFWIQGEPGTTGFSATQPSLQTRDVYGVTNNGATNGIVTFNVPFKDALSEFNFPGNNSVGVVSSIPFAQLDGSLVSSLPNGIDGVTSLDGLTVMFYNTGVVNEEGYVGEFYDSSLFDQDGGAPYIYPGSAVNDTNFEGGYYTDVSATFYKITYVGPSDAPVIKLIPYSSIPTNENITPAYGTQWIARGFYRNVAGEISLIPYNSPILDTLYYQDGTSANKVGVIKLIDNNINNRINVDTEVLGKAQYTSPTGVVFTNGLKVMFTGDIFPKSFANVEYYVEGVGTAIELISVQSLVSPGLFTAGTYIPFDTTSYDIGNYDSTLYVPVTPDYITIARNAINKNAWSRSNRWFHIDVINATASYNGNPQLVTDYTSLDNKAKRPIIEFYPNVRLFNSGVVGKTPIDFIDFRTTDALTQVSGQQNYYPDVTSYTTDSATVVPTSIVAPVVNQTVAATNSLIISSGSTVGMHVNDTVVFSGGPALGGVQITTNPITTYYIHSIISASEFTISATKDGSIFLLTDDTGSTMTATVYPYSTEVIVPTTNITGSLAVGQYITDSANALPTNAYVTAVNTISTNTVITVTWNNEQLVSAAAADSIITTDTTVDNYALFEGSRVVFAADTNLNVRNKIYVSRFTTLTNSSTPVITLTEADDGLVLPDEQTAVFRGYNYQGLDFHFNGVEWIKGQQKITVNQAPYFDIFDNNGISFGDTDVYVGTSFTGTTLFSYGIGTGTDDVVLGFPIRYSSVDNVGDISFDVTLNADTFVYVQGSAPISQKVNTGYVYNYTARVDFVRQLGWQTAVSPSQQYQIFEFDYFVATPKLSFTCDIAPVSASSTTWPTVQVYINNVIQATTDYALTTTGTTTTITFTNLGLVDTVVQILVLSDQVSPTAYYQIPTNLNNNPLNAEVTQVNVGDIRGQYQSIFYNAPNTTGNVFGSNNYRDLGNLVPYGNKIIQNSASLVLPGAFMRQQNHSLFNSLMFNSREYITFKSLLVNTVNSTDYSIYQTPAFMLDDALDQLTVSKTDATSFFWSDMLPSKAAYITNSYSFANLLDVSIYPLSRVYDFTKANYYGVLVYLTRNNVVTQLIRGVDYTVSTDAPSLTIETNLLPNDQITIKEYNQTYGSYVPNTPTKLGLYPATIPNVTLDSAYSQPTYFIVGHDGSYNKLYGDYDSVTGKLVDFRDQVLLEYETRVYNNLKLSSVVPVQAYEIMPGFFRTTDYSYSEILEIYSSGFLNWVGQNRVNYKTQVFNKNNEYTFNYRNSATRINNSPIEQGYWRGLYQYYYDTSTPDTTPWEMIGYRNMPTWWATRYGPAPYTSDNLVLWNDLAEGIDWNNGNPVVLPQYIRPELLLVLPVDSNGNLVSPFDSIVGDYDAFIFNKDWKVGDVGPTEFSYRRSSSYPFDLMRILALTKPAEFFNLGVDLDNYKYNVEFNQYLVNDRSHLDITNVEIYGNGIAKTSYINWIVDYEKQIGVDATTNIGNLLNTLDVRLVYRLAGFSDKNLLKFYVEKSSANSNNSSLLIPDESYGVLLYDNQPFNQVIYSGIVVQLTQHGYAVFGNSQTEAYFKTLVPKLNGNYDTVQIEDASVNIAKDYYDKQVLVPYGTEFFNLQEVAQFIESYGRYLTQQGCIFEQIENGIPITWNQMVAEFLYWAQLGWEVGSIATLNPSATFFSINKDSNIVQPLTLSQQNFVLNQNMYPIQSKDLSVVREGTAFTVRPLNQGDTIAYGQFNIGNIEHGVVFDNVTLFNDIIYNLTTGLRQNRITVRGRKTADWNGTLDAQGFILNQDNVTEWNKEQKYTKGEIVKYKNKYWVAIAVIQAKELFDEREWKVTDYGNVQKGLLPNSSTRSFESTLYYDTDRANLGNDADLLSFSLIGYRPRDYLVNADLTDVTQINVYKNLIKNKGTLNAASALKGATLAQGGIDYDIYENWAIKSGEFGGVLNNNFVEFSLHEAELTGNPSIVSLTDGSYTAGSEQEVPMYSLFNYGRQVNSPNILSTISADEPSMLFPTAGYANFNDVKMSSYFYFGLPTARNANGTIVPLSNLYVRDYFWLANYLEQWQIYSPISLGSVTLATNNLNGTVTLTFAKAHNLTKFQPFAVVNFATPLNGYYIVSNVVDPYKVIVNTNLNPSITTVTGQGVAFAMQEHRVATPSAIPNLDLLATEFTKNKVWVDTNTDGNWAVYRKSLNYKFQAEVTKTESTSYGSAVAYTSQLGYLIGDAGKSEVYRYTFNQLTNQYQLIQTLPTDLPSPLSVGTSFGATISYSDDIFVISEPTSGTPKVYVFQLFNTKLVDDLLLFQNPISAPAGVIEWGTSTKLSGDKNWLYISAKTVSASLVYVYRLSAVTGEYEFSNTLDLSLSATDNFGNSISTDYYGDTVIVGAPNQSSPNSVVNYGYAYVFNRTVQNVEAQQTSNPLVPQFLVLAQAPNTITQTATDTNSSTDRITVSSTSGFNVNDPVVFSGTLLSSGAIAANTVYYVKSKPSSTTFTISATRGGSTIQLATETGGSMVVTVQTDPIFVSVNGTTIADNQYAVIGSTLAMYTSLNAGDIVTISLSNFVLSATLDNGMTPTVGVEFGLSVDSNTYASELLVGAPFELNNNYEGAVHRFTNGGEKYGSIIGTVECVITTPRTILLNGFSVILPIGNAASAVTAINGSNITNVFAVEGKDDAGINDGTLIIQLIDVSLANPSNKLALTVLDTDTLAELGIDLYTETQIIQCPHVADSTQFGSLIKFNSQGSIVVSAPVGTRYSATTFDFTDDENIDNDTIFDNNATQWIDTFSNAGAVYMFDYLANFDESLNNLGKFVYAQSVNALNIEYGNQPMYGHSLDFNDGYVLVGTPNFLPGISNGQVIVYNSTTGTSDWTVYRSSSPVVDINKVQNIQLFSASTNTTLDNLDYIDPLQGKILGSVRQNIDVISNKDPSSYNINVTGNQKSLVWGAEHVGNIWFNTTNTRFVNYHQNDVTYNSQYWGRVFPGSDVAVYSWISSNVAPIGYTGPGTPYDVNSYSVNSVITSDGTLAPIYYFWARNTNIIFSELGKTLSDSIIQSYIANPQASGISYFAPLLPNTFGLYNSAENINANDTILHITFGEGTNDDVTHNQYSLIRANFADDFLPGIPKINQSIHATIHGNAATVGNVVPESLYNRMLDSLCGVDDAGAVVPNPYLPKSVQLGVLARPRQSFFINRFGALKNYLTYANEILAQFPITETRNYSFLFNEGTINPTTGQPFFVTSQYWSYINWWATGYDNNTKAILQVPIYADLAALVVGANTIVTVAANGDGKSETYIKNSDESWTRIGLTNGTIELSSSLWDYETVRLGFGDNFFDTTPYDDYPSAETRAIVRALNEEIYTSELLIYRNKSLILLFEYIQSETIENQNYLPWLNKTSLIDVSHTIRELKPIEVFRSDNQEFLAGYLNEAKPYHVLIKDFLFKYTGTDVFEGDITDFDLPAQYNTTLEQFVTPELVYASPSSDSQYLPTDPIWQTAPYKQWFDNYGVSITGQDDYPITTLSSYMSLNTNSIIVNSPYGFPINGIITIGTEQIGYSSVDANTSTLSGLTRGVNNTTVTPHLPNEQIYINLPAVLLLDGGRGYANPPIVTAYIDTSIYPAPTRAAVFKANMALDSVLSVTVIDPGQGYAAIPQIKIEASFVITFSSNQVSTQTSTIELSVPLLQTGDLVVYTSGSTSVGGLVEDQRYYVNVLESVPVVIIALYSNYADAINDQNRVTLFTSGTGTHSLSVGAIASCITSASPVRENQIAMRFDRTTYDSQITNWVGGDYYGSFYAGSFNNSESVSSSSISLSSANPPIDNILASAQGAPFEIMDVTNDQLVTWSSRTRDVVSTVDSTDVITIQPSAGGAPDYGYVGPTTGFYVDMPVKFIGSTTGTNLVNGTVYYVNSIINDTDFKISETVGGSVFNVGTATIGSAGLLLYVGEVTNTAVMTIDYAGILNATATVATSNIVTTPLSLSGQNGTAGFYTGLPIYFTGNVFGNVLENEAYYVTSVIDNQRFTMSTSPDPLMLNITATDSTGNIITCDSTLKLQLNDPVIFSNMTVSGSTVINFGNILPNTIYYVSSIVTGTTFTISAVVNGGNFALATQAAGTGTACLLTNQVKTTPLISATGSMTLNVGLPISPGQINGQLFDFYQTSTPILNVSGTNGNFFARTIAATIGASDRITIQESVDAVSNIYVNMPLKVASNIGNLVAGTTYYVTDVDVTTVTVTTTSSSTNRLTCSDTTVLYVNMPIVFTGTSLGSISLNTVYFVNAITSPTTFTISTEVSGAELVLTGGNGLMTGTGEYYIQVSTTIDGSAVNLSDANGPVTFTQYVTSNAVFDVSYVLGGYRAIVTSAGSGYTFDNTITIDGADIGGISGTNNLTLTVSGIDVIIANSNNSLLIPAKSNGEITMTIASGTPAGATDKYYLKVISENQVAVYSNALMTVPVSGLNFPYKGITSTTVSAATASTNRFTVANSDNFSLNDPIIFTGSVFGGVVLGQTYYIKAKPSSTTITISETEGGTTFDILVNTSGTMNVAKLGDFILLPEPFYFDSSIVKYNNRVYQCVISNNDPEFILGKWEELQSSNRRLNALDRVIGYYQPTVNMPGVDLTQLFTGITYPNSTYLGNAFKPNLEYTLDTVLTDQPFYPTGIDMKAVLWNGVAYVSIADAPNNSEILFSATGATWDIQNLTSTPIGVTDIIQVADTYVATSTNNATPILISDDALVWSTSAEAINANTTALNGIAYLNGQYVAVGENIVTTTDPTNWTSVYEFGGSLVNVLNDVSAISIPNFTGFVAVGTGQSFTYIDQIPVTLTNNLLLISNDGKLWTSPSSTLTDNGFNSVAANSSIIVVVGDNSVIYTSTNGSNWSGPQSTTGTTDLMSITYGNGLFVAVGTNGVIKTSSDGIVWTTITTATTETLRNVIWNSSLNEYIAVGDNNTVLQSTDGVIWTMTVLFNSNPTFYTVQGDTFESGYGPEELVPGVVTDTIMMTVATRPGTNWDVTQYQHVGYNVVSKEFTPSSAIQTTYSFDKMVQTPAQLSVFIIDGQSGLSHTIYESIDYSINWVSRTVTLNTPLDYPAGHPNDLLRIDVYEVGNGDQLVKANTDTDPIRINSKTGFNEIYVDCNYSAPVFAGSGVIRPSTNPLEAIAVSTNSDTNTITCLDVTNFVLDNPIIFTGTVFGGIVAEQAYYVKTISQVSNTITISETYSVETGLAGPTYNLDTASGSMTAIIQVGSGVVWTDPIMYHNGHRLVLGITNNVTLTRSDRNTVVCNNTGSLVVEQPVTFSNTIFGNITPLQTYYVHSIFDANEFTISETQGGPIFDLSDATGGSILITNEFAFGLADNGTSAKIIFANSYNADADYISYALFGETIPVQYGYTIPEVEVQQGDGSTAVFQLSNYVSDDNVRNAVVEIDGQRQTISSYVINPSTNTITFNDAPANDASVAITSYNLTDRQYFSTQYGTSGSGVSSITVGSTTHQAAYDDTDYDDGLYSPGPDYLTLSSGSTSGLAINDSIIFTDPTIGGLIVGVTYYVVQILNSTDFAVSTSFSGDPGTVTTDTGSMTGILNGQTVANIVSIQNAITAPIATTNVTATTTGTNYITCDSTVDFVVGQTIIFKSASVTNFGGIDCAGVVYFVGSIIDINTFTIVDEFDTIVPLTNDAGNVVAYVGGQPAVRVTTGINTNFTENQLVRIDGVLGSTQLNNTVYYAKIISLTQFDLYEQPYDPVYDAVNFPVTNVSAYVGDGYVWIAGLFTLQTTTATATSTTDEITVASTSSLVVNTPIIFTSSYDDLGTDILGGLIAGTTYYVKEILTSTSFKVSETRDGDVKALGNDTGSIVVTQWEQINVDRLWVTVNGYRVPSSKLRINPNNDVSILTTVVDGDLVIITSMIPTATPNEEVYLLNVSTTAESLVYRANTQTRTWLEQDLYNTSEVIYVDDITRITDLVIQNVTVPAAVNGVYSIGLTSDKNITTQLIVQNDTHPANTVIFTVAVEDLAPVLKITSGVVEGDMITITSVEGNLIYINGEQIKFTSVNLETGAITGLQRGTNGTGEQKFIPQYTEVFGILSGNKMTSVLYSEPWNSYVYNTVDGDPLQISDTNGADFLKVDRT